MSRAFTKESDDREWLGDVAPEISALERYLTKESGERVTELQIENRDDNTIHYMSNDKAYALDFDGRWTAVVNGAS
jgi:hypothetical protein